MRQRGIVHLAAPVRPIRSDARRGAARRARVAMVAIAAIALAVSSASADVFKCTSPRGNVTYSDAPCLGESSVRLELKEPVENRDPRPSVAPPVVPSPPAPAVAPANQRTGGYELSYRDRQRIANLEQVERTVSAYREQRQSATLEILNIRRGAVARMSLDDLRKKDAYWTDLASIEPDRRRVAAMQLANLFASYP